MPTVIFLDVMFMGLCRWLGARWGVVGILGACYLAFVIVRRLFRGFFGGEFKKMITTRRMRTIGWGIGLAWHAIGVFLLSHGSHVYDRWVDRELHRRT